MRNNHSVINKKGNSRKHLLNDEIRFNSVRLSGESDITTMDKVREWANLQDLDIMLVTDKSTPPIVEICDYNKYLYKQKKIRKDLINKQKKNTKALKEIRFTPNISKKDVETKTKKIIEFLEKGHSVKLSMKFKGRMIVYTDLGKEVLLKIVVDLENISKVNGLPKMIGKSMNIILNPK
jgi:translation initiation factor IF-3